MHSQLVVDEVDSADALHAVAQALHEHVLALVRAHGQTHIDKFKADNSRLEEVKNDTRS